MPYICTNIIFHERVRKKSPTADEDADMIKPSDEICNIVKKRFFYFPTEKTIIS